jgi:Conjugal transfer protein TraD
MMAGRSHGANAAKPFFATNGASLLKLLQQSARAIKRAKAMQHRVEAKQPQAGAKHWKAKRRERTRHLIELGGLVRKAGLVELLDDDNAVLLGAFLTVAAKLRGEDREQALVLWRREGKRAFEESN